MGGRELIVVESSRRLESEKLLLSDKRQVKVES